MATGLVQHGGSSDGSSDLACVSIRTPAKLKTVKSIPAPTQKCHWSWRQPSEHSTLALLTKFTSEVSYLHSECECYGSFSHLFRQVIDAGYGLNGNISVRTLRLM